MKPNAVVAALRVPDSTIRKYANEYSSYLSPSADTRKGSHRDYTDHDVRVIKLIIDMKAARQSTDNIHVTLRSLEAGAWERLPALDDTSASIIPSPAAMIEGHTDRAVMQNTIDMLREQIDGMKGDSRIDRDRINELERELSRSKTLLELYESGRLKPESK